jgi:hypothetical protein
MALITLNGFTTADGTYTPQYDTITQSATCQFVSIDGGTQKVGVTEQERGYVDNSFIQQACDNSTLIEFYSSTSAPFFMTVWTENSPTCAYTPPPQPSCDLLIASVATTDETETGANDGTVTITASTSGGTIQYSLDNVAFQYDNTFTNLHPGSYTVYAKDTNACTSQATFTINAAGVTPTTFIGNLPVTLLFGGKVSRWNAAFNRTVVQLQRTDYAVTSITQNGTLQNQYLVTLSVQLTQAEYTLAVNDALYLQTELYIYYGKAQSHQVVNGKSVLTIPAKYIGDDSSGFLNIPNTKPGYTIQLYVNDAMAEYTPANNGQTNADISGYLQTLVSARDAFGYDVPAYLDTNRFAPYTLKYRETWNNHVGQLQQSPDTLYATYSAKQLGDLYGGNMAEYVTFPSDYQAKWLSGFASPIYWDGLPFDLSFISSENVADKTLFAEFRPTMGTFVGGKLLSSPDTPIKADGSGDIATSPTSAQPLVVQLAGGIGIVRLNINSSVSPEMAALTVNIFYNSPSGRVYIMRDITVQTKQPCNDPYVYIKWLNTLGGWDYYRFGYNQVTNSTTKIDQQVNRYALDIENEDTINDVVSKTANDTISFGVNNVPNDVVRGLRGLKKSVKAMMLVAPYKWQTIVIQDGDFGENSTRNATGNATFIATLRDDNLQTN